MQQHPPNWITNIDVPVPSSVRPAVPEPALSAAEREALDTILRIFHIVRPYTLRDWKRLATSKHEVEWDQLLPLHTDPKRARRNEGAVYRSETNARAAVRRSVRALKGLLDEVLSLDALDEAARAERLRVAKTPDVKIRLWSNRRMNGCEAFVTGDQRVVLSYEFLAHASDANALETCLHEIAHLLIGLSGFRELADVVDEGHGPLWVALALRMGCSGNRYACLAAPPPTYHAGMDTGEEEEMYLLNCDAPASVDAVCSEIAGESFFESLARERKTHDTCSVHGRPFHIVPIPPMFSAEPPTFVFFACTHWVSRGTNDLTNERCVLAFRPGVDAFEFETANDGTVVLVGEYCVEHMDDPEVGHECLYMHIKV